MIIWYRQDSNPFVFGGGEMIIETEIDLDMYIIEDLGCGFKGYVFNLSNGKSYVFEKESGGWIVDSLVQVRDDIKACGNQIYMENQVEESIKERTTKSVHLVSFLEFFGI